MTYSTSTNTSMKN